jgi:hypothetical protein
VEVVGEEDGLGGAAEFQQRGVGRVLRDGAGEAAQDGFGFDGVEAQGGGVLDHLVVLLGDELPADRAGERRL